MTDPKILEVLETRFYCDDTGTTMTVREWLKLLLTTLWDEGEGFSGKRPLGNSSWQGSPAEAFIASGIIPGKISLIRERNGREYTEVDDYDYLELRKLVREAIQAL